LGKSDVEKESGGEKRRPVTNGGTYGGQRQKLAVDAFVRVKNLRRGIKRRHWEDSEKRASKGTCSVRGGTRGDSLPIVSVPRRGKSSTCDGSAKKYGR